MADNVENLMLEHLKRFQVTLERVEAKLDDLTIRVSNLESGVASLMQHLAIYRRPMRRSSCLSTTSIGGSIGSSGGWNWRAE